jgi:hypothetical protein
MTSLYAWNLSNKKIIYSYKQIYIHLIGLLNPKVVTSTELVVKIIYTWEEYAGNNLKLNYFKKDPQRLHAKPIVINNGEDIVRPGRKLLKGY